MADEAHEVTPKEFLEKAIKRFESFNHLTHAAVIMEIDGVIYVESAPLTSEKFLVWFWNTFENEIVVPKDEK